MDLPSHITPPGPLNPADAALHALNSTIASPPYTGRHVAPPIELRMDPNKDWLEVEIYRWQTGQLPATGSPDVKRDFPAALRNMAKAFDLPVSEWPAPFNLKIMLEAAASELVPLATIAELQERLIRRTEEAMAAATRDAATIRKLQHDPGALRLLEAAWGIIANAQEGNWDKAPMDWQSAARQWRDEYHARAVNSHPLPPA